MIPRLKQSGLRERRRKRARREAIARIGLPTAGSPFAGETALCIAYMCPWAHACAAAVPRVALVSRRSCLRSYAHESRPVSGLSGYVLDLLADQREKGFRLSPNVTAFLDELRPSGPTRSFHQRRPDLPNFSLSQHITPLAPISVPSAAS